MKRDVAVLVLRMDVDFLMRQEEFKKLGVVVFGRIVQRELSKSAEGRVVCKLVGPPPKLQSCYLNIAPCFSAYFISGIDVSPGDDKRACYSAI